MKTSNLIMIKKFVVGLLLTFTSNILLPYLSCAAGIDVFATVEGLQCQGSRTDPNFANAIVVRSLSGGISNSSIIGGSGGGAGKSIPAPLRISKDFDGCSPLLFRAVAVGQHFNHVMINFVTTDDPRHVFFEIELTDAVVQDMTLGTNVGLAQTTEQVSFIFRRMKLTDIVVGPDGRTVGPVTVECDFLQNSCK